MNILGKMLEHPTWAMLRSISTCINATINGHLEILVYAIENGCPWQPEERLPNQGWLGNKNLAKYAAKYGQLDILKYLILGKERYWPDSKDVTSIRPSFRWEISICKTAAKNDRLEIIKWAKEHFLTMGVFWDATVSAVAAGKGHFELLRWLKDNGCPFNESSCRYAAMNGHLDILKWLRDNGVPWGKGETTSQHIARYGHLEVLKYAVENGCNYSLHSLRFCGKNHKDIIEYLDTLNI